MLQESGSSSSQTAAGFPTAWRSVSFGTLCLSAGALVVFTGTLVLFGLNVLEMQMLNDRLGLESPRAALAMIALPSLSSLCIILLGGMLWLAGLGLCCVAPPESGTRPLALAALIFSVLFLLVALHGFYASLSGIAQRDPFLFQEDFFQRRDPLRAVFLNDLSFRLAGVVLAFAMEILTLCFVCAVAHHLGNESLARSVHWLLLYQIGGLAACPLLGFLMTFLVAAWPNLAWYWVVVPLALGILVIMGIACSWLLSVLAQTRRTIRAQGTTGKY